MVLLLLLGLLTWLAIGQGIQLRQNLWQSSESIRFQGDVRNAIHWGSQAQREGIGLMYDRLVREQRHQKNPNYGLDYAPIRLWIAKQWAGYAQKRYPENSGWQNTYEYHQPMLRLNTGCELLAALFAFLLVRDVRRASLTGEVSRWQRYWNGWALPWLAAMLLWFNPAVFWNAHAWPQWDVWVLPVFLGGLWLLWRNLPLAAGILIGVGCLAKGQVLMMVPLMVLVCVLRGHVLDAVRLMVGLLLGMAVVTSPFLLRSISGWYWLLLMMGVAGVSAVLFYGGRSARWLAWVVGSVVVITPMVLLAVLMKGWVNSWWMWSLWLTVAGGLAGWLWWRRAGVTWLALWLMMGLFSAGALHGGSFAWAKIGLGYGTHNYQAMTMGPAANLASLLAERPFRWQLHDVMFALKTPQAITAWWPTADFTITLTTRQVLIGLFVITVLICAIVAARCRKRQPVGWLLAMTAPWLSMFALMPQMHERYLLWAAGVSALWVAAGVSGLLLHAAISLIAWGCMAHAMLGFDQNWSPGLLKVVRGCWPDIAWATVTLTGVVMVWVMQKWPRGQGIERV